MTDTQPVVLVIDDDQSIRWAMRQILSTAGFDVAEADAGGVGLEIAARCRPNTVLLDLRMPDIDGADLLPKLRRLDPELPIIVVTAHSSVSSAVSVTRAGAYEFITKPFRNTHLLETVRSAIAQRPMDRGTGLRAEIFEMMGQGASIRRIVEQIEAVIATDYTVVLYGETGAGKEVIARALHRFGPRSSGAFVTVDCGATVETLLDSEFFGHEKGAYTGAAGRRLGCFELAAKGGTIFLDEIGNLPPSGQKALLRTLEDRTVRRVGGTELIDLDVRVIAATNDDLQARALSDLTGSDSALAFFHWSEFWSIERFRSIGKRSSASCGAFRPDLLFRLNEYVITIPPLRSRLEDVPYLAARFLKQAVHTLGRAEIMIAPETLDLLSGYRWPGNVRELRNVMRRVALYATDVLTVADVVEHLNADIHGAPPPSCRVKPLGLRDRLREEVRAVERNTFLAALEEAGGNKAEAARILGIDSKTYRNKLKLLIDTMGTIQ